MRPIDRTPSTDIGSHMRLSELDGLRGWSSLSVMLSHLIFGVFVYTDPQLETKIVKNLLEPFLAGNFDVCVFFVISGDALSASRSQMYSQRDFIVRLVTRYLRLVVPICIASFSVFVLLKWGLVFVREAAPLLHCENWLGRFLQGDYRVSDVLSYSLVNVFLHQDTDRDLIPFLWTMKAEFLGSLITISYIYVGGAIPFRNIILAVSLTLCVLFQSMLACFIFGIMCGHWRRSGAFAYLRSCRKVRAMTFVSAVGAVVIATYCNRVIWPAYSYPSIVGACVFVAATYSNHRLCRLLSLPLSRCLGRLSFPLYLVQFPVFISFTSGMVCLAYAHGVLSVATMWLIVLLSAGLSLLFAAIFSPVDKWATSLCAVVYAVFNSNRRQASDQAHAV
jgi:peptidoglycan/LPS O-acetylase OafA/YrhL